MHANLVIYFQLFEILGIKKSLIKKSLGLCRKLIYYKLQIDFYNDFQNFMNKKIDPMSPINGYQQTHDRVNGTLDSIFVYGEDHDIVYHQQMTLDNQIKIYSNLLSGQRDVYSDPISLKPLDLYSYFSLRNFSVKIYKYIRKSVLSFCDTENVSQVSFMSDFDSISYETQEDTLLSLEDPRDSTFSEGMRIETKMVLNGWENIVAN